MNRRSIRYWMGKARLGIKFLSKIYNFELLFTAIAFLAVSRFFPIKVLPDVFELGKLDNVHSFIWNLLAVTVSFSSLILTILLVGYNFYFKSTKRMTLEFIIDNPWMQSIFTFFAANISMCILGYVMTTTKEYNLNVVYILLISTFCYLVLLYPLVLMSLRYSTSIKRLNKVINQINDEDVNLISSSHNETGQISISNIEKNNILILKDIGINAIRDGDWVLVQNILNSLVERIIKSMSAPEGEYLVSNSICYFFVCNQFFRAANKSGDHVTIGFLYDQIIAINRFISKNKLYHFPIHSLEGFSKNLCIHIIKSTEYFEQKNLIIRDMIEIINQNLSSLNFTDLELPTDSYVRKSFELNIDQANPEAEMFWHYIIDMNLELLVDLIKEAVSANIKSANVYGWQIQSLISKVENLSNLTNHQKESFFSLLNHKFYDLIDYSMSHGVKEGACIYNHFMIRRWMKEEKKNLYFDGIIFYSHMLKKMVKSKFCDSSFLSDFFVIASVSITIPFDTSNKEEALSIILRTLIKMHKGDFDSAYEKHYLQKQSLDLIRKLNGNESLQSSLSNYINEITAMNKDFLPDNSPDFDY